MIELKIAIALLFIAVVLDTILIIILINDYDKMFSYRHQIRILKRIELKDLSIINNLNARIYHVFNEIDRQYNLGNIPEETKKVLLDTFNKEGNNEERRK